MNAPTAVRKKAEEADALIVQAGNTEVATPAAQAPNKATLAEVETPAPVEQASTQNQETEQLTKPLGEESDPWETKYQILQGKYNKEVPALHRDLRDLKEKIGSGVDSSDFKRLQDENLALKKLLEDQPKQITAPGLDELRDEYSSELVDGILNAVKGMVAPVQKKVEEVGKTVDSVSTSSTLDRFKQLLATKNIDFGRVNNDPLFVDEWLKEVDEYSGVARHVLLTQAFDNGDLDRAARFFTDYVGAHQTNSSQPAPNLEKHVTVPSSAGDVSPGTESSVWTDAAITQFYRDKVDGKYTPEEAARLESELFSMG